MSIRRGWTRAATVAAVACIGAGGLAAVAAVRAATLDPLPSVRPLEPVSEPPVEVARVASDAGLVARAVQRDPFRPDRQPPATRFRMPGEALGVRDTAARANAGLALKLIGTAVIGTGGFAMCQAGAEAPRIVRVGQSLAGYTLSRVTRGRAVFRDGEGRVLELTTPRVGS